MTLAAANGATVEQAVVAGKKDASSETIKWIDKALADKVSRLEESSDEVLQEYALALAKEINPQVKPMMAKSCSFPYSFILGLKIALDAVSVQSLQNVPANFDVFTFAIRRNIMLGGDSCGRVPVISCILATSGFKPLQSWAPKCKSLPKVQAIGKLL